MGVGNVMCGIFNWFMCWVFNDGRWVMKIKTFTDLFQHTHDDAVYQIAEIIEKSEPILRTVEQRDERVDEIIEILERVKGL